MAVEKKTVDEDEDKGKKPIVAEKPIVDKVEKEGGEERVEKTDAPKTETIIDTDDEGAFVPVEGKGEKETPIDNAAIVVRYDTLIAKADALEANIIKVNESLNRILTLISPSVIGVSPQPVDRYSQQIDAFLGIKPNV